MSVTASVLPMKLSTHFTTGSSTPPSFFLTKPTSSLSFPQRHTIIQPIKALKYLQGKVVCSTNDKTVSVEVTRLAPHPKYKRRVRKKKKYQAHDENNQFQVGDVVQLEKSRPISKTKTFIAVPLPPKNVKKKNDEEGRELGLPLESQQAVA